jgi:hypothetical protein
MANRIGHRSERHPNVAFNPFNYPNPYRYIAMKSALFAALMTVSVFVSANDNVTNVTAPEVEQYKYSEHLDIYKVLSMTTADDTNKVCGPVEAQMVYVDHKGVTHDLEYTIEAYGCQNG